MTIHVKPFSSRQFASVKGRGTAEALQQLKGVVYDTQERYAVMLPSTLAQPLMVNGGRMSSASYKGLKSAATFSN